MFNKYLWTTVSARLLLIPLLMVGLFSTTSCSKGQPILLINYLPREVSVHLAGNNFFTTLKPQSSMAPERVFYISAGVTVEYEIAGTKEKKVYEISRENVRDHLVRDTLVIEIKP